MAERKKGFVSLLLLVLVFSGFCSISAATPAKMAGVLLSNALSAILKQLWTITSTPKTVMSNRPMMKFESGYTVETVFDGSKLGIEPFAVEVMPDGELLVLDSVNSNIFRISLPLSRYSRPKLIAGSAEGYSGHIDGKLREARMNHPKGFAVDDIGNIYVADSMNMAIRKISDTAVTTIAGGRWNRGGHMDGPSEDAKFSDDFEVVYVGSSCSILVIDRGKQAIREIQLRYDHCAHHFESNFPLGFSVLLAAGFFGYMLALLQRRLGVMFTSKNEPMDSMKAGFLPPPYEKPLRSSVRPPLIQTENYSGNQDEEGFFMSIVKLFYGANSSLAEIFRAIFRRKSPNNQQISYHLQRRRNPWEVQESFVIPDENEPPPIEERMPTIRKTSDFMANEMEKIHRIRQGQAYFNGWEGKMYLQQQQYQKHSSASQPFYEQSSESKGIAFGEVHDLGNKKSMEHGDLVYDQNGMRSRIGYNGYNNGY